MNKAIVNLSIDPIILEKARKKINNLSAFVEERFIEVIKRGRNNEV